MINRVIEFLRNLKEEDKIEIITHKDCDGICSASLLKVFLKNRGIIPYKIKVKDVSLENLTLEGDKVIFLDLALEVLIQVIQKARNKEILVIDHHPFTEVPKGIVFHNPREKNPHIYIPASYLVYRIGKEVEVAIEKYRWLAGIGVIGDKGEINNEGCRRFVEGFEEKRLLYHLAEVISAIEIVYGEKGCLECIEKLSESESPKEALMKLSNLAHAKYELENILRKIEKNKKEMGRIIIVDASSKYGITSLAASRLSEKYRDKIVVAYSKKEDGKIRISGRSNGMVNIGKIFGEVAEEMGAQGGGHEQAAGAEVKNEEELNRFINKVIKKIKLNYAV